MNNILWVILTCVIGFVVPGILGYAIGVVKSYVKKEKNQNDALKCLLRSNITGKYYVYKKMGYVPRYEKENINYMYTQYKRMDGNSYVDSIMIDFNNLPIEEVLK